MSAKSWAECPQCSAKHAAEVRKACERAARAYGQVSEAEYRRLNEAALRAGEKAVPESLREDYEIGVTVGGVFVCVYRAECEACGWAWEYKAEEKVTVAGKVEG